MLILPLFLVSPCLERNCIRGKKILLGKFAKAQRIKPWEKIADKFFLNNFLNNKYDGDV